MIKKYLLIFIIFFMPYTYGAEPQSVKFYVEGLTCQFCTYGLKKKLNKLDFVYSADVSLKHSIVRLTIKPGHKYEPEVVEQAVINSGFNIVSINSGDK